MVQSSESIPGSCIPKRYTVIVLGFFGMLHIFAMRGNLSVTILAMVNVTDDVIGQNETQEKMECAPLGYLEEEKSEVKYQGEQYDWDTKSQGMILGAFFYGYILTQIPGGYISEKCGAKWIFGGGIFITSVLTLLTPISAHLGRNVIIFVRFLEGCVGGPMFPAINVVISKWSPLLERSRVSTIVFMGVKIGTVITMPVSGWLSSCDLFGGWPSAFYLFGITGCIWFVFWAILVYESPSEHPSISDNELSYFGLHRDEAPEKKLPFPWRSVLMSMPMWSVMMAHFADDFGYLVYYIEMPTYLSHILHLNITEIGSLSALSFMMQALVAGVTSYAADKLRSSGRLSVTTIRKIMNTIGLVSPALCLLWVTFSGCRSKLVLFLLALGLGLNGFGNSGYIITHVDMSPCFSGTLYGITNSAANVCGMIVPVMVEYFTSDGATIPNWNKVFYVTSALYVLCALFYLVFASAEEQPWGKVSEETGRKESSLPKDTTHL